MVVDAISNEEQERQIRKQVENLEQFLGALAQAEKEKRTSPIPMVVVISKWDRVSSPIDFDNPANEQKKLEKYLAEHTLFKSIILSVQSKAKAIEEELEGVSIRDLTPGISYGGNSAIFPTSAFGKAVLGETGAERPDPSCPNAFCLVEPYCWLANKCDELQTKRFEKRLKSIHTLCPFGLRALYSDMQSYKKKSRARTQCKSTIDEFSKQCIKKRRCFFITILMSALLLYDFGCLAANHWRVNSWESTIQNRESCEDEIRDMKKELISYKLSPYHGLLLSKAFSPSNRRIEKIIENADNRMDDLLWTPVKTAEEPVKKAEFAQEYIEKLPNGLHAVEARKILSENAETVEKKIWDDVCRSYQENPEKGYKAVCDYLDTYGKKAIYYPEAIRMQQGYLHKSEWVNARAVYEQECLGDNLPNIISTLKDLVNRYGTSPEYCSPLIRDLPKLIETKLTQLSANSRQGMKECEQTAQALRDLEKDLRQEKENELADVLLSAIQNTEQLRGKNIDTYDKSLYDAFLISPNSDSCEKYIREMDALGGGAMRKDVENYKSFLDNSREPRDLRLKMDLYWGPKTPIYTVRGTVVINGTTIYDEKSETWKNTEKPITNYKSLPNVDPTKNLTVDIRFVSEGNWWGNEDIFGSYKENNVSLAELNRGKQFVLEDKYGYSGKLKISVTNAPKAPELPSWKKK